MKSTLTKTLIGLVLFSLLGFRIGFSQQIIRLVEFTNVWKYDQAGQDLGTAWKDPGYDDSAWPAGAGLLGLETSVPPPYPIPINTLLALGSPQVITYYFR